MPVQVPDLDDRSYADLVEEGLSLIPAYSPEWTNHNASDPGITFVELFAFISDVLLYRLNRISYGNRLQFLKMITGEDGGVLDHDGLEAALREASSKFRQCSRAVTCDDYERIAREGGAVEPQATQVVRAKCFERRDFEASFRNERYRDQPGHTSVVLIPADPWADEKTIRGLCGRIRDYFEPRRLLTSRVHVNGPRYLDIEIHLKATLAAGGSAGTIRKSAEQALTGWFHPLTGGPDHDGWPFGRSVHASDIYRIMKAIPGVRALESLQFKVADSHRLGLDEIGSVSEIELRPDELPRIQLAHIVLNSGAKTAIAGANR